MEPQYVNTCLLFFCALGALGALGANPLGLSLISVPDQYSES